MTNITAVTLSDGTVVNTFPGPVDGGLVARAFTELHDQAERLRAMTEVEWAERASFLATVVLEYPDFDCDNQDEPRPICKMARDLLAAPNPTPPVDKSLIPALAVAEPRVFDCLLVRAYGETEHPAIEIVNTLDEARAAVMRMMFADPDADDIAQSESMFSGFESDMHMNSEWEITFEIGGITVEEVTVCRPTAPTTGSAPEPENVWRQMLQENFERQDAGFERCYEALGITDDRERSWSALVIALKDVAPASPAANVLTDEQIESIADKHCYTTTGAGGWIFDRDRGHLIAFARALLAASTGGDRA